MIKYTYKNITLYEIKFILPTGELIIVRPNRFVTLDFPYEYPGMVLAEAQSFYNPGADEEKLNTTYVNYATFNPVIAQLNSNDNSDVIVYNTLVSVSGDLQSQIVSVSGDLQSQIYSITGGSSPITDGNSILSSSASGSIFRTLQNRNLDYVTVKDYGAIGDGITDDTNAIDLAASLNKILRFPPGTYVYNGNGIEMNELSIYGEGTPTILLGNDKSFIVGNTIVTYCYIDGMVFYGGYGAIRHSYTGTIVNRGVKIINCDFLNYSNAAISCNTTDWCYWRIDGCTFHANNDITSMGIALAGDNAGSVIRRCSFENNAVHIKHSGNGWNIYIENNDFIRYNSYSGTPRIDIWCTPLSVDTSDALFLRSNKFGNENLASIDQDYRLLFADEGSGGENSERFPSYTDSDGRIANVTCTGNTQGGRDQNTPPFVTSYTYNVWQLLIESHTNNGTPPDYIVEIKPTIIHSNYLSNGNMITLAPGWNGVPTSSTKIIKGCNIPGMFHINDYSAQMLDDTNPLPYVGGLSTVGFKDIIPSVNTFNINVAGDFIKVQTTDSISGNDAISITGGNFGSLYFELESEIIVGKVHWIEFDIKQSGSSPAEYMSVRLVHWGVPGIFNRFINVLPTWRHIRIPYIPMATDANQLVFLCDTGTTFDLGRVRFYQSEEPILNGRVPIITGFNDNKVLDKLLTNFNDAGILKNKTNYSPSIINVKDFGAVGDGVIDDTDAIQNSINIAQTVNVPVFIPSATYKINGNLTIDATKTSLTSDGAELDFTGLTSGYAIHIYGSTSYPSTRRQTFPDIGGFSVIGLYGTSADGLLIGNSSYDGTVGVSQIRFKNITVYRFRRNISFGEISWRVALEGIYSLEASQYSLYNPSGLAENGESMGFYHCLFSNGGTVDVADAQWFFYSSSFLNTPIILRGEAHCILHGGNLEAPGNSGSGYYYVDAQDNSYCGFIGTNITTQAGSLTTNAMFKVNSNTGGGLVFTNAKIPTDGSYQPELTTGYRTLVEGDGIVSVSSPHLYSGPVGTFDYFPIAKSMNKIINGDAELGTTDGWSTLGTGTSGTFTADVDAAKNGTYGFKLSVNSASTFRVYQTFAVNPGQQCMLSMWSKGVAWTYQVQLDFYDQSGNIINSASSNWQSNSVSWISSAGIASRRAPPGASSIRLSLFGTGDVIAYFDEIIFNII